MTQHWSRTCIILALALCTIALIVTALLQPLSAATAISATTTMSATWWVATPTPIVAEPVIMAYEVYLPEVWR